MSTSTAELPQLTSGVYTSSLMNCGTLESLTTADFTSHFSIEGNTTGTLQAMPDQTKRRVVQVFIADSNENIPLEKSLLYQDEKPYLTDLTDQELFYEVDIKSILDRHNEYRVTVKDKDESTKDNPAFLEKAKIRDLKMTVVTVAAF